MLKVSKPLLLICLLSFIAGCSDTATQSGQVNYEETKKMVVDILKTDDGKKAIQEVMTDDKLKQQLVMDQTVVKDTIEQTLTSDKGVEFWKKAFSDPKFSEGMAKSMKTENQALLKDLMNDPEYRGMMIEVLKEPELQKEVTDILKTKDYRDQMQKIVSDTFESPLFKAKIQDLLIKAADEVKSGKQGSSGDSAGGA
ncbi:MAG: spore germination protein GerD [Bacillus sp. (in: firmicutes)]|jgi:spore germination protein D|uniref:spore germination lipoprotein GerD n=1 Tax=Bacillus sp. 1NLA3E TaxID=666686 RepID=UPI000247F236|nr:spore germination lipoprotein GerD [Bacillus sp. 1NLA3E]AGK51934.1 spore germination protein GerD [Bacillus sp. 1NLA3E]MDF2904442.1 spore germination protein GerD [Bacillus sp. (in: firmicutes)]